MKAAEYASDFCLIAKRVLTAAQYKLFNLRHLMGADWRVCAHRLNLSKDPLHHEIYSIEQRLGRAYCECQPHALFPVDDYFCYTPSVARQTPVSS